MALKSTSSPITVSTEVNQGVLNTFEVVPVDLQLNPLDQEVFVVTAVKIDFIQHPLPLVGAASDLFTGEYKVSVCKSRPAAFQTIGDSNCIASSELLCVSATDAGSNFISASMFEQNSGDSPPSQLAYLDIIATDNFFIALDGINTRANLVAAVRIHGYRAKADAATYAALVQSEMLSA